jgi:ADP-heptose:LPS heptosyltransferase
MRALVFKVNQLGDNVVFVAVTQQLRRIWPDGLVTVFTSNVAAPLYRGPLGPSRLIAMPRAKFNHAWRHPIDCVTLWRAARAAEPDACLVSFDQGSVAHMLARISGAPHRLGSAQLAIRVPDGLTRRVAYQPGTLVAEWNWQMGRALAAALGHNDWPTEPVAPDLSHLVKPVLRGKRPCIVIHAGASLPYRQWHPHRFAELANRLSPDFDVTWIARPEVRHLTIAPAIRQVSGDTLEETVSWLGQADLYIGNNSGPLHLASAVGCPGIVIAGPAHYQWDPAWHRDRYLVLRAPELACLPCEHPGGAPERCINREHPMACMDYWSVDEVERRARDWLDRHLIARPQ